jgi:hypothetical protein
MITELSSSSASVSRGSSDPNIQACASERVVGWTHLQQRRIRASVVTYARVLAIIRTVHIRLREHEAGGRVNKFDEFY